MRSMELGKLCMRILVQHPLNLQSDVEKLA